jgi:hypothetical protein
MTPSPSLTGSHLLTYQTIFQSAGSQVLEWRSIRALFEKLGRVEEEADGNLTLTRNGQTLVLHPARTKDISEAGELSMLRRFLERSETALPATNGREPHLLLVINHHEARLYRSQVSGGVPNVILPHEPSDYFRHAPHSKDFSRGQEKPDPNSFFQPVAEALQAAGQILVFGTGTGMSSEMDQFIAWAKIHHPDLTERIIGAVVIDEHHLTEGQLLAKAREFYAKTWRVPA